MKALKITTRETDKLRDRIKLLDTSIDAHKHMVDSTFNTSKLVSKQAERASVISTLSAMIDAKAKAIVAALACCNGRAVARTISTYAEVWAVAERAEDLLAKRGVAKKNRVGTTVEHYPAGPSASAYKYGAISTHISLKRVSDGWRLVGVSRTTAWPRASELFELTISPEAAENVSRAAFDGFIVRSVEEATA